MAKASLQTTYTASEARDNLYRLIRHAAIVPITIHLQGEEATDVVVVDKEQYESMMETLDVMSNPEEMEAIAEARVSKGKLHTMAEVEELVK